MRYAMVLVSATHPDSDCSTEAAKNISGSAQAPARAGVDSAAKVKALMKGRFNVSYGDLNELAFPVLRHRIKMNFEAVAERVSQDDAIRMIIDELNHRKTFKSEAAQTTSTDTDKAVESADDKSRRKNGRK